MVTLMLIVAVPLAVWGLIWIIKYFIRYGAKAVKKKNLQQEELNKMKIEDLK
ncbi:hypothetical protein M3629_22325 [Paenibacillus polysaccharolyticus]|uniref:hypothetical protein n=1 Tax=Paenibacillus polysaccharolyticus TaxID=582692 RepID=UPI00204184B5|nr:hypothetical protein [Paenibacillus polysaccharolyticus]MCM3135521.1 hypothetical protein [Paenibacillus polysaccharolyticus]